MGTEATGRILSDLAVPPGEFLADELEAAGITQQDLADRSGRPPQVISEIINGRKRITPKTALQLERVLGVPAYFWVGLEADFQLRGAKLREIEELESQVDSLAEFPVKQLEKREWIEKRSTKIEKVAELLKFFGVASFSALDRKQTQIVGLRLTANAKTDRGALHAWLREGEIEGQRIETAPYDESRFREALLSIRAMTSKESEDFEPEMRRLCAAAGVSFVVVEQLPKSGASGAARWLTPKKALLQLSIRYKWADHFWFSFFHEAKHILDHRVKDVLVEPRNGRSSPDERDADKFAQDILINPGDWIRFVKSRPRTYAAVSRFADEIGIDPAVVVGRLQHEDEIPPSHLNAVRRRFAWKEEPE